MGDLPERARAVIIGAGIMGSALVHHLALQGWRDLVLINQGPFPQHRGLHRPLIGDGLAARGSRLLTASTADSVRQYRSWGSTRRWVAWIWPGRPSGSPTTAVGSASSRRSGATTRRSCSAPPRSSGSSPTWTNPSYLGGLYLPQTGVVDAIRAGTLMR